MAAGDGVSDPSDRVLVVGPTLASTLEPAGSLGLALGGVPSTSDNFNPDLDEIAAASVAITRLAFLCNPNNLPDSHWVRPDREATRRLPDTLLVDGATCRSATSSPTSDLC